MNLSNSPYVFRLAPHLVVPAALAMLGTFCQYSGLDEWLIQPFYNETSHSWPYKSLWMTSDLIHKGGKFFIIFIGIVLFGMLVSSFFYEPLSKHKWNITYVLLGAASGIMVVAILKDTTHIYSPYKLVEYGGTRPHIRLFDTVPPGSPIGHSFPAGHASGAFGLISAYFVLAVQGSKWRYAALGSCLSLGLIFGIAQQARGKHFFSHDLFALAICWSMALLVLYVMRLPRRAKDPQPLANLGEQ